MYFLIGPCGCIGNALLEASRRNLASDFAFTGSIAGKVDKISTDRSVFRERIEGYNREKQLEHRS